MSMKNNDITCSEREVPVEENVDATDAGVYFMLTFKGNAIMSSWKEKLDEQKEDKIISKDICGAMDPV